MIGLANRAGGYADTQREDVETLAVAIVEALLRKRAEIGARRHLEQIEALREIDKATTSILDLPEVLDVILKELERVIPYHSATIFLLADDTARVAAGRGFPDMARVLQVAFPVAEDALISELLQAKRPLVLADARTDQRFLARGGTEYVRSWIGAPLISKGKAVGVLTIDHREPGVYGAESAEMAEAFANQVAIAVENARLYAAQQEINAQLRAALRAKDEMIQNVSHELRTPLTIIMGYAQLLDEAALGDLAAEQQQAVAIVRHQGERLLFMVNRLLTLQTFGPEKLRRMELHLASWLTEVVAPWQVRTAQAGIQLAVEVEAGLPPIAADADFLGQVLENLLDNAVKFSPGGGTVTVRAYVEDERRMTNDERPGPTDGGRRSLVVGRSSQGAIARPVVIAVSDQGVGIPRDKLQQIFRRFYQVNGGTTRQFGGVGIGLALCQTIVAAHGGRIWAESAGEGQGSTFYVALPVGGDGAAG